MKAKQLPFITLLWISCLALLQACIQPVDETQNCNDSPSEYYNLSVAQKAIIPYTGYDTIHMVSNMGDTIHCIGTGKQYFNTRVFEQHSHPSCAGYGTEKFYEAYKIEFIDSLKGIQIELSHYDKHLLKNQKRPDDIAVTFKGGGFFVTDFNISDKEAEVYFGDTYIRGSLYKSASKAINYNSLEDSTSFMLINKTNGILAIQLNQNERWELLPD